jgi:hypothetical protein
VTDTPAPRFSWVLLVVLVAALATGAAASILIGASTSPPPPPGPAPLVDLPFSVLGYVGMGFLAAVVVSLVVWRLTSSSHPAMNRAIVSVLVVIFLGILFVVAARSLGLGGPLGGSGGGTVGNTTSSSNSTSSGSGGILTGPGGQIVLFPSVPGWVPLVILIAVVLIVVVVAVPQTRRYLSERRERGATRRRSSATVPAGLQEALARASDELSVGGDPRLVILALYGQMLLRLQPMVGAIETSTPEEIRAAHLVRLGVRPEAARTLTRLFEEARYSTHPMGAEESARAQEAVRATLDDLARRTSRE